MRAMHDWSAHSQTHSPSGNTRLNASFNSLTRSLIWRKNDWFLAARDPRSSTETDMTDPLPVRGHSRPGCDSRSTPPVTGAVLRKVRAPKGSRLGRFHSSADLARRSLALEVGGQTRAAGVVSRIDRRAFLCVLVPGPPVDAVVQLLCELREPQRMERVAHHRELVRLVQADCLFRKTGLRAMRQAGRMQRDRADLDALSRAEVPGDVIDHLLD